MKVRPETSFCRFLIFHEKWFPRLKIQSNSENIYFEISYYLQKLIISERKSCSIHNFARKLTANIITTKKNLILLKKSIN